jgi:hypothetical protein
MKKLLAVIVAGMFAVTATAPVFAADKMEKKEKKAETKKKAEPKKAETKKKAEPKKAETKKKAEEKKK